MSRWMLQSREHTNFTYHLDPINRTYFITWVADLLGVEHQLVSSIFEEIEGDKFLEEKVSDSFRSSPRRWLMDSEARLGRRLAWYAIVRLTRPELVVEAGIDKGLGTLALLRAVERNGIGQVVGIDTNPNSGAYVRDISTSQLRLITGDSLRELKNLQSAKTGIFIHDSLHTYTHEIQEYSLAARLFSSGYLISDNATKSRALFDWAAANNLRFSYFSEHPLLPFEHRSGVGVCELR